MCRHLGYLGPPLPVRDPICRGTHSLREQSWAPTDMRGGGTVNVDGFGIAWWRADGAAVHYRNAVPIWADPAVDDVLSQIDSSAVLGAVRSATVGMPIDQAACAPFVDGKWAFSHNGVVPRWRTTLGSLAKHLDAADLLGLQAATDSAALWLLLLAEIATEDPAAAMTELIARITRTVDGARLNFLLGDGERIWATTYDHSLSVLVRDDSVVVCSEPYDDDPAWQSVPDRSIVTARPGRVSIEKI